jgi:hypothetical protein
VAVDQDGTSLVLKLVVAEGRGGTLRIGRTFGVRDALVSDLVVDAVQVKRGRFQVRATSHDKNEAWHTVQVGGTGDFRAESFGVSHVQVTIRETAGARCSSSAR